jgi:hypothetical protein
MSFSYTHAPEATGSGGRSLRLSARVWLHRASLMRALAAGADPSSSPELARRAEQLTSLQARRRLAAGLNRALRAASQPSTPFTAAVPPQRTQVLEARTSIERLAHDLVAPGEVRPRGVVLVHKLLTDGASPLFTPGPDGQLDRAVRHAHTALLLR